MDRRQGKARASLVRNCVASVLIYRFWQDRRRTTATRGGGARRTLTETARKSRERLH
jgi:hypothetical protein